MTLVGHMTLVGLFDLGRAGGTRTHGQGIMSPLL